jgi:hypothetical protein
MKFSTQPLASGLLAATALLSACGGGNDTPTGTLRLALTDAPTCGFDRVDVTVQKVRVHQSSSAADADAGWSEVVLSPPRRVDLLSLTNGVLTELGQTMLPAGKYTQLRLVLAANDASSPLANSITPIGGAETALTTPSATQSGLKMNVDIEVAANKLADFILDFDACRSFVKVGQSNTWILKPVITVVPRLSDAGSRVVGFVSTPLAVGSTSVSVQQNGVLVKSTPPDSTGKFVLYPVPAGNYDLVVSAAGRVTATITGVPVVDTAFTNVNASSAPIDPPTSTMHIASGTVTTGNSPIDATVAASKAYTGGPTVLVATAPVDGGSGAFSHSLPSGAPVKMGYVANATTLTFAADSAVPTGKYTLAATSGGATQSVVVDVTSADSTGTAFTFP